ncbi:DNA fragmentation factor subunit beta isoform X2 [Brienomyrus brachyistius]|uniref:DNA fragmentation factor subunit beta isoform X2 n=1 Tax=Brienomyrus brachyistius TaxID=42636 RepID=UPI0020B2FB8C|nr:DNA fragmentation factor subunit beta isoform X2 [Brienomyrus brachyistius]
MWSCGGGSAGMFRSLKKNKLVKLRRRGESTKYGVAAANVKELLRKGCSILKVPLKGSRVCLYEDGTEVGDDYFRMLPDNVELVLLPEGQSWDGFASDISLLLGSTNRHYDLLIKSAKNLLTDEQSQRKRKILSDLLQNLEDNSESEKREEDSDWFQGIDTRFKTKSDYMKYNCESRIRGYLKEVDGYASNIQSSRVRTEYKKIVTSMLEKLKATKYNGCYFDRREGADCMCSGEGWFSCQGAFDQDSCSSLHSINPYGNRESRILFSTWNLDHMIEKKRTIIPTLVDALGHHSHGEINWEYFYRLLFTCENLKLDVTEKSS